MKKLGIALLLLGGVWSQVSAWTLVVNNTGKDVTIRYSRKWTTSGQLLGDLGNIVIKAGNKFLVDEVGGYENIIQRMSFEVLTDPLLDYPIAWPAFGNATYIITAVNRPGFGWKNLIVAREESGYSMMPHKAVSEILNAYGVPPATPIGGAVIPQPVVPQRPTTGGMTTVVVGR